MFCRLIFFLLCALLLSSSAATAATNSLVRSLNRTVALTNSPVVVTANFTNGGTNPMRGFYYSDQLPSGSEVTTVSVKLNGRAITNYTFESGLSGDVYAGRTPYRWILERPKNFTESNPIPPQATAQIIYSIRSATVGTLTLQPSAWIGFDLTTTNACFGFDSATPPPSVSFVTMLATAPLSLIITNGRVNLMFTTELNVTYLVEYKDDLRALNWMTLTNVVGSGTTMLVQDAALPSANRFYRTRLP